MAVGDVRGLEVFKGCDAEDGELRAGQDQELWSSKRRVSIAYSAIKQYAALIVTHFLTNPLLYQAISDLLG